MTNLLAAWVQNHQQYLFGLASGYALTHIPYVVGLAFHQAMKIDWLRQQVLRNPEQAKALIDQVAKELDKDVDEEAKQQPPK